jgi:hypothetical protein
LPTNIKLDPDGAKGHYSFNFPIQPDNGEKNTLFQISYHVPYSGGKFTFKSEVTLPTDNVAVLLPKSMTLTQSAGAAFKSVPEDANIQTFVQKNAIPGKVIEFTISGTGTMPQAPAQGGQQMGGGGAPDASTGNGNQPGGGIGAPINTPDPLSKYKWWILGGLALLLAAGAAFLLRMPGPIAKQPAASPAQNAGAATQPVFAAPQTTHASLLSALKEELFALESEKIAGTLSPEEYAKEKAALEIVLKRALNRK